jgi:hypothetical protein
VNVHTLTSYSIAGVSGSGLHSMLPASAELSKRHSSSDSSKQKHDCSHTPVYRTVRSAFLFSIALAMHCSRQSSRVRTLARSVRATLVGKVCRSMPCCQSSE